MATFIVEHWIENFSPATGEHIANIPCSSSEDIDLAVEAALDAAEQWSQFSINERADWLRKLQMNWNKEPMKSPNWKASTQANRLPLHAMSMRLVLWPIFISFAEQGREFESEIFEMSDATNRVLYKPVGVAGLITPWNLPLYLLSWKVAPALLMGNTIVPSHREMTPMTKDRCWLKSSKMWGCQAGYSI